MKSPLNRRTRTLMLGAVPVILLGGLLSVDHIPGTDIDLTVPYAAEGPGPTVNTLGEVDGTQVVEVTAPQVYPPKGNLNMTTVSVRTNMTLAQALGRWLFTDDTIVPIDTVLPPNKSDEEFEQLNQQAFVQSEAAATVAAMEYLNIPVKIVVADVIDDSAAAGVIRADDEITQVDGTPVSEPGQVQQIVRDHSPGDELSITFIRAGQERTETLTLGQSPQDSRLPMVGISMTSKPKENIEVDYNLQDIGGPSAGMMFTLAVIDKLVPGDLTGGHFIAGTGTIGEDSKVGPIGGIVHKVAAANEAGAELFLAPADNCAEAVSRDHGDMQIARVENLDDAINAIEAFDKNEPFPTCG